MARIEHVIQKDGINVSVIFDPPLTADLFRKTVDLAVTSDRVGFTGFSRLVDSTSENTKGFLTVLQLDRIRDQLGDCARDPSDLLRLPPHERVTGQAIDRYCSLVRLRAFDRNYLGKFLLFVRSPLSMEQVPFESYALNCVEATLYVAAFAHCRSIYFAGFGGIDGSFSDETIAHSLQKVYAARREVRLDLTHVYFKYWPLFGSAEVERLAQRLAQVSEADPPHVDPIAPAPAAQVDPIAASPPPSATLGGLRIRH